MELATAVTVTTAAAAAVADGRATAAALPVPPVEECRASSCEQLQNSDGPNADAEETSYSSSIDRGDLSCQADCVQACHPVTASCSCRVLPLRREPDSVQRSTTEHVSLMDGCWLLLQNLFKRLPCWSSATRSASTGVRVVHNNCASAAALDRSTIVGSEVVVGGRGDRAVYCGNKIVTTKYTWLTFLPKNLLEQMYRFANIYFLVVVGLNFVPEVGAFGKELAFIPVALVLTVSCVKDAVEDLSRHRSDAEVNSRPCSVFCSSTRTYVKKCWSEIRVGDFVRVSCNEAIPADLLLVTCCGDDPHCCYIETANLDGESNLKRREPISGASLRSRADDAVACPTDFRAFVECDPPNAEIYKFKGKLVPYSSEEATKTSALSAGNLVLRGSVLRNTDSIEGLVIYAGHDTKTMLNMSGPRYKRSRLEQYMNCDVTWCLVILLVLCVASAVGNLVFLNRWNGERRESIPFILNGHSALRQSFIVFFTYIIVYQAMVPLSLYATLEVIKGLQVFFIEQDLNMYDAVMDKRVACRALNITEDLGQVQHVFCDKTGTLTENNMIFRAISVRSQSGHGQVYIDEGQLSEDVGTDFVESSSVQQSIELSGSSLRAVSIEGIADSVQGYPDAAEVQLRALLQIAESSWDAQAGNSEPAPHDGSLDRLLVAMAACNTVMVSTHSHRPSTTRQTTDRGEHHLQQQMAAAMRPHQSSIDESMCGSELSINTTVSLGVRPLVSPAGRPPPASAWPATEEDAAVGGCFDGARVRLWRLARRLGFLWLRSGVLARISAAARDQRLSAVEEQRLQELYEAESPDELALVEAACRHGCRLIRRSGKELTVSRIGRGETTFEILATLPFDSNRRRMSIVVRDPDTGGIVLYCKGADSAVFSRLATDNSPDFVASVEDHVAKFAKIGLRTLCLAYRELSAAEFQTWHEEYLSSINNQVPAVEDTRATCTVQPAVGSDGGSNIMESIERELLLIGATGIEDTLQEGVGETIAALRDAAITTWLLTGDKKETAVNIGYSCGLISAADELVALPNSCRAEHTLACQLEDLSAGGSTSTEPGGSGNDDRSRQRRYSVVVDGVVLDEILGRSDLHALFAKLALACSTIICCRMTPSQKAGVVDAVKKHSKSLTLAIGDGANDVNMIRTAHVGVGITGVEGSQAAMAADFAIARFRYLRRLLFVHGHWSYARLAAVILYNFYKNANLILVLFWYQFYNGFSGQSSMDQVYLFLFHVVYTSVPPIVIGAFDKDYEPPLLWSKPSLYVQGTKDKLYCRTSFWIVLLDATYQSLAVVFLPLLSFNGSDIGLWTFGTMQAAFCVATQLLTVAVDTKTWTFVHVAAWLFSSVAFWSTALVLSSTCVTYNPPSDPYWELYRLAAEPSFWLLLVLVSVVALLPRMTLTRLSPLRVTTRRTATHQPDDSPTTLQLKRVVSRPARAPSSCEAPVKRGL